MWRYAEAKLNNPLPSDSDAIAKFSMMGCQTPLTPGHEVVGTVAAVGPGEKRFKVNDYVGSGWHGGHCSNCKSCRKGDFVTCENGAINGITRDGGYAEYCILRTEAGKFHILYNTSEGSSTFFQSMRYP